MEESPSGAGSHKRTRPVEAAGAADAQTRPPRLGKHCAFSPSFHRALPHHKHTQRKTRESTGHWASWSPFSQFRTHTNFRAISEFPKGRKYLISLSFRGKASVRPAQVGGFDVNIVIHGSTAVRGRGDLVAYRWALWKLTAPWTHRTRPPHLGKRCAFSTSSTGPFPSNHSRKTPKGPKIALGNPDRPNFRRASFPCKEPLLTLSMLGSKCDDRHSLEHHQRLADPFPIPLTTHGTFLSIRGSGSCLLTPCRRLQFGNPSVPRLRNPHRRT